MTETMLRHYEAMTSNTSDWVVMNTRADMIVASRLTKPHAQRIANQLNRAEEAESAHIDGLARDG